MLGVRVTAAVDPPPDPSGTATGDKSSVVDAGGAPFVVPEPTDKADPDYAAKKKAFDEYREQAAKEPLAVKLADSVGHVRIATNAAWTLNTGYLVLFMQAGFALLTCGLVRRKNAAHLWRHTHAQLVSDWERPVGLPGRQGLLPDGARLRRGQQRAHVVRGRIHGNGGLQHRRSHLRADHVLVVFAV
jgi:hypothetical protein